MTRRTLLAAALLAGCSRKLARRYFGWLFVASAAERAVVVADLSEFRRAATIRLPQDPAQILRSGNRVFVTCPEARALFGIDPESLRISGKADLQANLISAAVVPGSLLIAVVTARPELLLVDPATLRIAQRIALPAVPSGLDVTETMAAVAASGSVVRVSLSKGAIAGTTPVGAECGPVLFRRNEGSILVGLPSARSIVTIDSSSGALLARLPLPFRPARFCFNDDGGQMFVTGSEGDMIAIVDPYQNQVDQTMVGGSTPCGMAVGNTGPQSLLYVTNRDSGDLTIFDIDTRRLASSIHVGGNPGEVLLTPDGQYALVVGHDTGDVAVVRLSSVLDNTVIDKKILIKPLFTVFATGGQPRSVMIFPRERA